MRALLTLAVVCSAFGLSGCYGIVVPPPLPEWAMHSQVNEVERPSVPRRAYRARTNELNSSAAAARPDGESSPETYGAEWQAKQEEADERLRRRMNICRGC